MHFKTTANPPLIKGGGLQAGGFNRDSRRGQELKKLFRIMRLTTILLTIACMHAAANGGAQGISVTEKNVPIEKVLKEIKRQSGFDVFYNIKTLETAGKVSVVLKNATLEQALDECFKNTNLTYTISDKVIVISKKEENKSPNEEATIINEPPPPIDITGKVTDENGNPLVGASVKVKGDTKGTVTNNDGVFVLKGVNDDAVLEISYVGFEMLSVSVNNRTSIVTTLKAKPENLGEVVINKGYYTEKMRNTVGNVGVVTAKDIEKQPVQNPLLALQGRVPGVEVYQTTGINGGGVKVRIQGINSIGSLNGNGSTGTDPLIVIDGVPYPSFSNPYMESVTRGGSALNYINPSDIESISVLKDADATAIYGSRAANGAIIIATKKAQGGKPKLSIDLQQGWGKVTRHIDMMNTRQYLDMRYEALKNDGLSPDPTYDYDLTLWDTTRYTDWQKELIGGTAQYTNINAGVSGGSDLVQYLVSGTYNRQTTVFPGDFADKSGGLHFSLNGSSPNQRMHIQLSGSYQYNENGLPGNDLTQSAVLLEPNAPKLYNSDGTLNWAQNPSGSSTWTNPLVNSSYYEFKNTTTNLVANMRVDYTIFRGLTVSSDFGYNSLESNLFQATKLESRPPESRARAQRSASFGSRNIGTWIIEPQLQLEKSIGKGRLDALLGTTVQQSSLNFLYVRASGQPTDELMHSLAAAKTITAGSNGNDLNHVTRINGLFGRIGYNWDKKYLINLTGRRDGSSKFGEESRFHNFWSAGAGWIFSEEKIFQSTKSWLSFGKLRGSYGTTGSDQIADYSYLSLYNILTPDISYQGITSFDVAGLANPFLQWEETRKLQGGIDLSAFDEKIALSVTYAHNRSSNQLVFYSLPDLTGFSGFTKNFPATIQNTSWEFGLNTINVKSKNFNWSTNINLTIPQNKLIDFPGIELTSYASGNNGVIIGQPLGIQKKYQYGGVDPATGKYMLIDTTGKARVPGSLSPFARSEMVSTLPKYYGGITNTVSYKGFQLDFLIQFVYQIGTKDLYFSNPFNNPGSFDVGISNQPVTVLKRWQKPGQITTIGRYNSDYSLYNWAYYNSDGGYSYTAGSYVRLKNAALSWQFPDVWTKKAHLKAAKIYFRGQNLATFTKYTGLDPETRSISTLPPLQMWTIGAKIEL